MRTTIPSLPRIIFLLTLAIVYLPALAQQPKLSMLWRIDHPNHSKPSYIYTVPFSNHAPLFHFPDSLFSALQQVDQVFMPFSFTELTSIVLEGSLAQNGHVNSVLLKEAVSEQLWPEYAPLLQKKLGKPADEITLWETFLFLAKMKKISDPASPFPVSTDLFLFEFARRLRKPVAGIRSLKTADGEIFYPLFEPDLQWITGNNRVSSLEKTANELNTAYLNGDLPAIQKLCGCSQKNDRFLEGEMRTLAGKMDSLSGTTSALFFLALENFISEKSILDYLPSHLRITPVIPHERVPPSRIPLPPADTYATAIYDSLFGRFKAVIPGEYFEKRLTETTIFYAGIDFYEDASFFIMGFPADYPEENAQTLIELAAKEMLSVKKLPTGKVLSKNGATGMEYVVENGPQVKRLQLFGAKNHLLLAMCLREDKKNPSRHEERFFAEIELLPPPEPK